MAREDPRLAGMREICAELRAATCEISDPHAVFRVRGRTFAYYLDRHRGDDAVVGAVFKLEDAEETAALLASRPERFYRPAYVGARSGSTYASRGRSTGTSSPEG